MTTSTDISQAAHADHPVEVARRALVAAAEVESDEWAAVIRRFAAALPPRTVTEVAS